MGVCWASRRGVDVIVNYMGTQQRSYLSILIRTNSVCAPGNRIECGIFLFD